MKEITGHVSDVVDAYQITSKEQRQNILEILQAKPSTSVVGSVNDVNYCQNEKTEGKKYEKIDRMLDKCPSKCDCKAQETPSNISEIIQNLVEASGKNGKVTIKVEIEVKND